MSRGVNITYRRLFFSIKLYMAFLPFAFYIVSLKAIYIIILNYLQNSKEIYFTGVPML